MHKDTPKNLKYNKFLTSGFTFYPRVFRSTITTVLVNVTVVTTCCIELPEVGEESKGI